MVDVAKIISELDNPHEKLSELDIFSRLESISQSPFSGTDAEIFKDEFIAFSFQENYSWDKWNEDGWKTYFGPLLVRPNEDKTFQIFPHIDQILSERLIIGLAVWSNLNTLYLKSVMPL